ncbi:MAG: GNAT family N-acetyltransferase [Lachnospiraceae bacterium]|nr:GNAT family N-acetyltransferase [Lachnospiraceae bacterium]
MILKRLSIVDKDSITIFFKEVFTKTPWNDDWSDEQQLDQYIMELIGNPNSLTFGFFDDKKMIGLAMGCIRHWYEGAEYHIDELCISTDMQGKGIGTEFIRQIEGYLKTEGLSRIFLQTDRGMPAYEFYKKRGFVEMPNHVSFIKAL